MKLFLAITFLFFSVTRSQLSPNFYSQTCPNVTSIVREVVTNAITAETRMAGSLLRLHFHDCFVQGCDGSILLDDTANFTGEKTAFPNRNSVRGFEVIDAAKTALENSCQQTVSCADIVALAARDSVLLSGGSSWKVLLGRRDSRSANLSAANQLPAPTDVVDTLLSKFQNVGLNTTDLVALSGGHTIGRARCTVFSGRLFNFSSSSRPDPTIESSFLSDLQSLCPQGGDANVLAPLDRKSNDWFDNHYFKNLLNNSGLLQSDQELYSNSSVNAAIKSLVELYSSNQPFFFRDFASSMIRMGNINPLTGTNGEIRKNCRMVN